MLTYKGGQTVSKGTYWDMASGRRIDVANEAVLAGDTATYVRMSSAVMLLAGPLIGLVYTILMPFVGIVALVALAVDSGLVGLYDLTAKSISFGWRPRNAYLSGKKKKNARR
jgi:hypothetical protein